jgi:hypothetical protein
MSEEKVNKTSIKKVHTLTTKLIDTIGSHTISEALSALRSYQTFLFETIDTESDETKKIINNHFDKMKRLEASLVLDYRFPSKLPSDEPQTELMGL